MAFGVKAVRDAVESTTTRITDASESAAAKLAEVAADTKSAVIGAALLGLAGLIVAIIALVVAVRGRNARIA